MARTAPERVATRSIVWLGVITAALFALLGGGVLWDTATWAPKLALDLEGGTQIILTPVLESGQTVTQEQLDQSVSIIRDRVDAAGVSEAEVTTQGGANVVVSIPGVPDEQTLDRIQSSAKLEFRPVIYTAAATAATAAPTDGAETAELSDERTAEPTDASDPAWVTEQMFQDFQDFQCASLLEGTSAAAPSDEPLITCDQQGFKYILGPVEVSGERIADASAGLVPNAQGQTTGVWGVFITFDAEGTEQFADVATRLFPYGDTDPRNRFAVVLDGWVITSPTTNAVITDGKPVISGSFTQETAKVLADQLKFGALPIGFEVQSSETVSAALGSAQLVSGVIAGIIGMILVVIYSLFQYRLLGLVTVASLLVAGILTYVVIAIMSWRQGYRLSLAGVAGLIVAIGLTADSFIVYFERIRDELRDGKHLTSAVESGWKRALRTILSAKFINLLSAVVLFVLAVGNVRGFAFTLGLTVVIDVLVVVLFTHPVLTLLANTRFFGSGHPWSGLDPTALGAVYRGRAQFRAPVESKKTGASREAQRRQTLAERKAAEAVGASAGGTAPANKASSSADSKGKNS